MKSLIFSYRCRRGSHQVGSCLDRVSQFPGVSQLFLISIQERHAKNLHRYGQMSVPLWILNGNQQSTRLHIQLGEEPRVVSVSLLICISNHRAAPSPPPSLCDLPCYHAGNLILNFVDRNPVTHKMLHSSKKENNSR